MSDKVPLGGTKKEPPVLEQGAGETPHKKKRRAKSNYEIQRDRAKGWDMARRYIELFTVIALVITGYYLYRYFTEPEYRRNDRFAVMEKIIVEPTKFKDTNKSTTLGGHSSVVYPPKYVFVCLGENTKDNYYILVDEHLYSDIPLRTLFSLREIERYQVFNSMTELKEHYASMELSPEAAEEDGNGSSVLSNLKDVLGY